MKTIYSDKKNAAGLDLRIGRLSPANSSAERENKRIKEWGFLSNRTDALRGRRTINKRPWPAQIKNASNAQNKQYEKRGRCKLIRRLPSSLLAVVCRICATIVPTTEQQNKVTICMQKSIFQCSVSLLRRVGRRRSPSTRKNKQQFALSLPVILRRGARTLASWQR